MTQEITTGESFAELFSATEKKMKEGEVTKGRILSIDDDHVQVDVGFKSEGFIDLWEFMDEQGKILVKVGDEVDVLIEEA
ncbi:MAG: S1 RNA-binding domain-containing protein, partial [bacterium]|nr:S1 RNA-binding domain-containing protein [bacterium]